MRNSFFLDNFEQVIKNNAHSYKVSKTGFEESIMNATTIGANGLHTILSDLCKWVNNYNRKIVGNDAVLKIVNNIPRLENLSGNDSDTPDGSS